MARSLVEKVMWVGRATVFAVGLVAIFALLLGVAYVAFSTLSGNSDQRDAIPPQVGIDSGADQTLSVEPLARRRAPTQGFAHVNESGTFDPTRSKAVNSVTAVDTTPGMTNQYCFDLAFVPDVVVGSPFINNSGVVATATPPDGFTPACPATHQDAAVRTYASDTGAPNEEISFKIVFMR